MSTMQLVRPARLHLAAYRAALQRGWSADTVRGAVAAQEELQRIADDADLFLAQQHDLQAAGPVVTLPDGSQVARLPSLRLWMWDAAGSDPFIGSVGLRWAAGGVALPPHVLGHIGYAVVPWQQQRGHATRALAQMLPVARAQGLASVELTTDPDNMASQRVITANGGVLMGSFDKGAAYGHRPGLRFRITLA